MSRQDMFKADRGIGVEMTDRVFQLAPCHDLPAGLGMLQNLPSAVVAHVLNPSPGSTVLDMCASPGGETHPRDSYQQSSIVITVVARVDATVKIADHRVSVSVTEFGGTQCLCNNSLQGCCLAPATTRLWHCGCKACVHLPVQGITRRFSRCNARYTVMPLPAAAAERLSVIIGDRSPAL